MRKTSATVKPDNNMFGDSFERGLDPWHEDAFPMEFKHVGTKGERGSGWFVVDGWGNFVGFVPDGTPLKEKPNGTDER